MARKIVTAIIVVPLAVVIVAFAVANRQIVTVSFDPFSVTSLRLAGRAAAVCLIILVADRRRAASAGPRPGCGRADGGSTARRLEREVADLRAKVDALGGPAGEPTMVQSAGSPPHAAQAEAAGSRDRVARRRETKRAARL